jgi:hypothetical protein
MHTHTHTHTHTRTHAQQMDTDDVEKFIGCLNLDVDLQNVNELKRTIEKQHSLKPSHTRRGTFDYILKIRAQAVFNECMELANFPFDIQELNIPVTINEPEHHFRIVVNQAFPPLFQASNFQMSDIFHVPLEDVVMAYPHNSSPSESSSGLLYPRCTFTIYISRKGGYYVSNVMVPMAVLTMLTMVSCSVEPNGEPMGTGDRLSVTLTLLLTAVAYKFVVASSLPQVCMYVSIFVCVCVSVFDDVLPLAK